MSLLKTSIVEEEAWAIQKLFIKKEGIEELDKCPRYLKQWVLRCPSEKERERNKER
jgi:hypothetical protein